MKIAVRLLLVLVLAVVPMLGCGTNHSDAPEGEGTKTAADPSAMLNVADEALKNAKTGDAGAGGGAAPTTPAAP